MLQRGKDIDTLADTLSGQVEAEEKRIGGMVAGWNAEQKRLAEEERQRKWEAEQAVIRESARIQREAEAKAHAEQAERDRVAREEQARLEAKANAAKSAKAKEAAAVALREAQERKAREDAEAADRKVAEDKARDEAAFQAEAKATAARLAVIPATTAGVATRQEVCFEVEDITKLYEAAPYLVKLEPNTTALKAALKSLAPGQHLPGVRHWMEARSSVR